VPETQLAARVAEGEGLIATAVVGHDTGHGDAEACVIGDGRPTFAGKGGRPNPDRTGLSDFALALAAGTFAIVGAPPFGDHAHAVAAANETFET
jgi:hypothetical protein